MGDKPVPWVCPECHERRFHFEGDRTCLRQQTKNLMTELAELKSASETAEPYWVLYDSRTKRRYIKKSNHDGSLKIFDCEKDARSAKKKYPGTDYAMVQYFTKNITPPEG